MLARAALVVERDHALGRAAHVRHDEADARIKFFGMPLDLGNHPARLAPASGLIAEARMTAAHTEPIKDWSLTSLKDKLIKIGAKVVSHGRYVVFQMAEVAIPRQMFQGILRLIAELRPQPPPAPA